MSGHFKNEFASAIGNRTIENTALGSQQLYRICGWDAQPEVIFRSYFHPRLGLTTWEDWHQALYEMIRERSGVAADESHVEFMAVGADRLLARVLNVAMGAPLLRRERTVLDADRRPMEYAVVHYHCQSFKLSLYLREK